MSNIGLGQLIYYIRGVGPVSGFLKFSDKGELGRAYTFSDIFDKGERGA